MPFIAIALALTLFLGGSAAVVQTPEGQAATSHVAHAWNTFEAKITGHASVDTDVNAQASADATSTTQAHNGLMIRADDNTSAQTQGPALNADGSVKVNVF